MQTPPRVWWTVGLLLAVHSVLLGYSAHVHSPTLNEPAHLVAGISHWRFGRFELYNVNPPLVRMVAALPVMAVGCEEDWSGFYQGPGARPEWRLGGEFLAANGDRAFCLFTLARWACIPFSLLGGVISFLWARDLYGQAAGILACLLWCFSPNIMGHAALITADAHATALGLAACYAFWLWLKKPSWNAAFVAGIVLGIAELAKTTLVVFFPLWPVMWAFYRALNRPKVRASGWLREGAMLLTQLIVAVSTLNLGYGCEDTFRELGEFRFVSRLFSGQTAPPETDELSNGARPDASNRFADSWLRRMPMPFPGNYLAGMDIQRRDFEMYDLPSYLHGSLRDGTWWYYYLYGLAVKVPLGTWLLVLLAASMTRSKPHLRGGSPDSWRDEFVLLAPALAILVLVSSQSGFNHHLRYVLPSLPLIFVWSSKVGRALATKRRALTAIAVIGLTWSVSSTLWSYPHTLSYFNGLVGGPRHGHEHLLSSNIDWGQDLKYLKSWLNRHPHARPLYLAYFGPLDPSQVGIDFSVPVSRAAGEADFSDIQPGWYAASVNLLMGHSWFVYDGKGGRQFVAGDALRQFRNIEPDASAGYSICVYAIGSEEAQHMRCEPGGPDIPKR